MKKFTKLATLSMALLLALGMGALTACNNDSDNSSSVDSSSEQTSSVEDSSTEGTTNYTAYEFTVKKADGSNADGYMIQLCILNEAGEQVKCFNPQPVANGKCVYTNADEAAVYAVHVLDGNYDPVELAEEVNTEAEFGAYEITLK